jgi:hypothetical protein
MSAMSRTLSGYDVSTYLQTQMCVTFFAIDAHPGLCVLLAFSRDEFLGR